MGWLIFITVLNLIVATITAIGVYYSKFHPNADQKSLPTRVFGGSRKKNKPKWTSDESAYEIEQKELKNRRVL